MSHSGVREVDKGFKLFMKRVKAHKDEPIGVEVGIFESSDARENGGTTNAQIAAWMEFGTAGIPERSFLRGNADAHQKYYLTMLKECFREYLEHGTDLSHSLGILGEKAVGDTKRFMTTTFFPPNAESTIKAKGSSTPLIDTGQLRASITSRVVTGVYPSKGGHGAEGGGDE